MRFLVKLILVLASLGGIAAAAYGPVTRYLKERNRPQYRTMTASKGEIVSVVNATGTVEPVLSVHVGSFVSGPIIRLHVDFNDEVREGDLLAEIDPRIYEANVARDRAALATRKAEVERVEARLQNATNDEKRALGLREDNPEFISDSELDQYRFSRMALEAELMVARAAVEQAEANLSNSEANLNYTRITAPVDGIVIDRKIDPGQTLAAQFQTPELFVIAPDMRERMHIFASVDEADIGLIRKARDNGQKLHFTVDAWPGELFEGAISQIRLSPTTTQNVVTYPVVISAPNTELKLLPGMTADISFRIEEKTDVVKIPNAALRFYPKREHVREEDRGILDGTDQTSEDDGESVTPPVTTQVESLTTRRRHVWVREGDSLRAIEVETGISDYQHTELVSGEVTSGQELVVGLKAR
ncbi:efflux RND transporter periplasmic adaptor subunit [Maioricimonas sp. JC845]|uniref:efflux RND transporter periplasmic adaptor subunit n=1 Tax=Maioricimonas sp. JC845 TaxID=3232138 RepID=UPI00345A34D9